MPGRDAKWSEMTIPALLESKLLAVAIQHCDALPFLDPADLGDRQAPGNGAGGKQDFVIVAAGEDDFEQARIGFEGDARGRRAVSTIAATPDTSQMWPRSATSPSEMSIAAVATRAILRPRSRRGCGKRYRSSRKRRCAAERFFKPPFATDNPSAASPSVPVM